MCSLFGFRGNDLLTPIKTALRADLVEENRVSAVTALYKGRSGQLHVNGTASARSRLRSSKFRYSHDITSFALSFAQYKGDIIQIFIFCQEPLLSGSAGKITAFFKIVKEVQSSIPALFAQDRAQCREEAFSKPRVPAPYWS